MRGDFRDLDVYKLATDLAYGARISVDHWPRIDRRTLGAQFVRGADSIGANIAEAMGRYTRPDQAHFLRIAHGSAYELQHWLTTIERRGLDHPPKMPAEVARVIRMISGLLRRRA